MAFMREIMAGLSTPSAPLPPDADFWYSSLGYESDSGVRVSPESAMRLSAVFSCIRVVSETIASLPLIIYKHLPDGGKQRATEHPLYEVLHDSPNQWQTSLEFIEMMQAHLELRGNAFAVILAGPRGAVDSLVPLHPDRVQVYRLPNGRLKYEVRNWFTGGLENYAQEEIFHLRGLSSNGLIGMSTIAVQREVIGRGLAMQEYGARFFANDSTPNGLLEHPGKISDLARKNTTMSWQEAHTAANRHKIALLEEGMKYVAIGVTNKDSQFLEATLASREEICGMYRVPPHKIGILNRSTLANIEQQNIEFVTDCIRSRVVRIERRISMDLIEPLEIDGDYFVEFQMDALLRGDLGSRYAAYAVARNWGWASPNDICRKENQNPIPPEKGGDDYLRPANMVVAGAAESAAAAAPVDPADTTLEQEDANAVNGALLQEFAHSAARRVVRKEVTAMRKALVRAAEDDEKFAIEAKEFYSTHAQLVAETMRIRKDDADAYARDNLASLLNPLANRIDVLDGLEQNRPKFLADLALGVKR
jgi:HK97 family phage portal protein